MGNAAGIGPAAMINRLVDRAGTPAEAQLAKVAQLQAALRTAAAEEQAKAAVLSPTGEAEAPIIDSGAAVDRLI